VMCPAVGQGALAIETRFDGGPAERACRALNHAATNRAVAAERAVLASLGGGCQVPIGAHAWMDGDLLRLVALVASPDGERVVRDQTQGGMPDAERIGADVGRRLLERGGREILAEVYGATGEDRPR